MISLRRGFKYLFGDFKYVPEFGAEMDYETYWKAKVLAPVDEGGQRIESYKRGLLSTLIDPGSRVLDVGCGDGGLLAHLMRTRNILPFGVEVSSIACEMARERGVQVVRADVTKPGLSLPKVDYVIISQVLEHLPNPEVLLSEVKDTFSKFLLVDIPNTGALNDRLRLMFGKFPKQWIFHAGEHLRFWTVADFLSLSSQLGYRVLSHYGLFDPDYQFGGIKFWSLWPRLFARYVLYVLRRAG